MLLRNEAKVGLLVFFAIVVLIAMYWFLRGFGLGESTFPVYAIFSDARKLDKGADVRMAGVKIGFVKEVKLTSDSRARVDMIIWDDTIIPADSVAKITTGAFIGDFYVDMIPGSQRACLTKNQRIKSAEPINYEKMIGTVGDLLDQLKVSVAGINSVLADKETLASFKDAVKQLDIASKSAAELVKSAQNLVEQASPDLKKSVANMAKATDNAIKITQDVQKLMKDDNGSGVRGMLAQAKSVMTNLNATILEAKSLISKFGGSTGKIDNTLAKIEDAAGQADEMMKNLNSASGDLKDITSDKEIKKNIKDTMRNAAEATAQANALLCNLNKKIGGMTNRAPVRKSAIPNNGLTMDSLWNTSQGEYRFDANYALGVSENSFVRLGAYNVGENTRANMQFGQIISDATSVRYGLYASRVGFGLDQKIGNRFLLSADGLRPNDPQYDLRGVLQLGNGFGLYGGYSDILNDTPDAYVGVHYAK